MPSTTLPAAATGLPDDADHMVFCDALSPVEVDEFGFVHIRFSKLQGAGLREELAPAAHLVMSPALLRSLGAEGLRALVAVSSRERDAVASGWLFAPLEGHA